MGDRTKISWSDATWNPTSGCDRISTGCDHCLGESTRILMADMSWQFIGKIQPGDKVVSFTESPALGQNRVYEIATVEKVWSTRADAVEIEFGDRTITASVDHKFLSEWRPYWREAQDFNLKTRIVDIGIPSFLPSIDSESYLAGYIAGVVGGDGTMRIAGSGKNGTLQSYMRVAVLASDTALLNRLEKALLAIGCVEIHQRPYDGGHGDGLTGWTSVDKKPMTKIETRRMANLLKIEAACQERDDADWKAGFLAGFLDTDGCYSGKNLRFNQTKENGLLDATRRYIADLGFLSVREDFRSAKGRSERLAGDLEDKIRFLSTIQPALARKTDDFHGRRFRGKTGHFVTGVRRIGERDLVDMQTSSGTFIAEGLATHNCYALAMARRLKAMGAPAYQNDGDPRTSGPGFALTLHPDRLDQPLNWRKPRRVFVDSMSDLFHADVPDAFLDDVWATMACCPRHRFQILTKRPQRLLSWMEDPRRVTKIVAAARARWELDGKLHRLIDDLDWPLAHVHLGVSIENDRYVWRANHLRRVPAALRFLSCEPLLGPLPSLDLDGIGWVIAGAESGRGARPMDLDWVREIRDRCNVHGVPFFLKQTVDERGHKIPTPRLDGRTWTEMP